MPTSTSWQLTLDAAERYQEVIVPTMLGPAAHALVDEAHLQPDERVVDLGCGTGAVARYAAKLVGTSGHVTAIDVNMGMLQVARSLPPEGAPIEWLEHSAQQLSLPSQTFDVVLCAQCLQFLERPDLAVSEMRRVAKSHSRVLISIWCALPENPYFHAVVDAISQHINPDTANAMRAGFRLSDLETLHKLFDGVGFETVEINPIELNLELPSLQEFIPRHISATPMAAAFKSADPNTRSAIVSQIIEQTDSYKIGDGIQVPFRTYVIRCTVS